MKRRQLFVSAQHGNTRSFDLTEGLPPRAWYRKAAAGLESISYAHSFLLFRFCLQCVPNIAFSQNNEYPTFCLLQALCLLCRELYLASKDQKSPEPQKSLHVPENYVVTFGQLTALSIGTVSPQLIAEQACEVVFFNCKVFVVPACKVEATNTVRLIHSNASASEEVITS